jgi:hypothetical protein
VELLVECAICFNQLACACGINPCGHDFCYTCIRDWVKAGNARCPTCSETFKLSESVPNRTSEKVFPSLPSLLPSLPLTIRPAAVDSCVLEGRRAGPRGVGGARGGGAGAAQGGRGCGGRGGGGQVNDANDFRSRLLFSGIWQLGRSLSSIWQQ